MAASSEGASYYICGVFGQHLTGAKSEDILSGFNSLFRKSQPYLPFEIKIRNQQMYVMFGYFNIGKGAIHFMYLLFDEYEVGAFIDTNLKYVTDGENIMNSFTADYY